jgi:hypothetical protein
MKVCNLVNLNLIATIVLVVKRATKIVLRASFFRRLKGYFLLYRKCYAVDGQ